MKYKNLLITLLISIFTSLTVTAQNEVKVPEEKQKVTKASILNTRFSNLPLEKRREYLTLRANAHRYFSNKRTFETLMAVHQMRHIFEGDPIAYNLMGAVYVEFRDFDKAREIFSKAVDMAGEDPKILFNLAELEFCDNQWVSSINHFESLLKKIETQSDTDFSRLVEFKILLCKLALSKANNKDVTDDKKNEYFAQAKQLANKYTYLLDSPYYYYANAALAFYEDDKATASNWIITAKKVFSNNPNLVTSWDDTMVEFGYIEAHYGKHYSKSGDDVTQ
ncbi:MAG: tetratricopeptide (TPR) repeat protein [Cryomorphaceae bacterium]|jgi:tetratricopeptide (TPR) repeat protein